uniref:tRNA methyltransferase 10B n=1 Tax=Rousettus aegyptiacus TaxID=9407 RepID=A0A7J8IVJ6_ROUAE|nr:tRNA methyltransferase 10B [Rousettus aegyptiacus]
MASLKASSFYRSMWHLSYRRERRCPQAVQCGARKMSKENSDTGKE